MIRHNIKAKIFLAVLTGLLAIALPSFAAQKIWGSYENKIDDERLRLSIYPIGGNENSTRASIIFDLLDKKGDLEIDGAGIVKGQTAILYSRQYKLTATVRGDKLDVIVEESCGDHRFYEGYGYYNKSCSLGSLKSLAILSKGLKKR